MTRHGSPQFPAAIFPLRPTFEFASSVVSDASKPLSPLIPTGNAIPMQQRFGQIASRSFPLPVVTAPRSTENRNTHKSADRGFVPRRLSYASRRPKLFTGVDCLLGRPKPKEADTGRSRGRLPEQSLAMKRSGSRDEAVDQTHVPGTQGDAQ